MKPDVARGETARDDGSAVRSDWPGGSNGGAFFGWVVGVFGFGLIMGNMVGQVRGLTGTARDWYLQVGGSQQILDAYRAFLLQMAPIAVLPVLVLLGTALAVTLAGLAGLRHRAVTSAG